MIDHACGDVRVMVLHGHGRHVEIDRELRRQILRVEVVRDHVGNDTVEVTEMIDRLNEGAVGREVLEVADVMARDHETATRHRDGVLELRTEREHLPPAQRRELDRLGCVPA